MLYLPQICGLRCKIVRPSNNELEQCSCTMIGLETWIGSTEAISQIARKEKCRTFRSAQVKPSNTKILRIAMNQQPLETWRKEPTKRWDRPLQQVYSILKFQIGRGQRSSKQFHCKSRCEKVYESNKRVSGPRSKSRTQKIHRRLLACDVLVWRENQPPGQGE